MIGDTSEGDAGPGSTLLTIGGFGPCECVGLGFSDLGFELSEFWVLGFGISAFVFCVSGFWVLVLFHIEKLSICNSPLENMFERV
jgi:hypothetical protein